MAAPNARSCTDALSSTDHGVVDETDLRMIAECRERRIFVQVSHAGRDGDCEAPQRGSSGRTSRQ